MDMIFQLHLLPITLGVGCKVCTWEAGEEASWGAAAGLSLAVGESGASTALQRVVKAETDKRRRRVAEYKLPFFPMDCTAFSVQSRNYRILNSPGAATHRNATATLAQRQDVYNSRPGLNPCPSYDF
jgi:hypothetical protein